MVALRSLSVALMAAGVWAAGFAVRAECKFAKVVEVPITVENYRPVVAVKINGHDTRMFVDTGAFFSAVSDEAAKRLELKPSVAPFGLRVGGIGGASREAHAVEAADFSFVNAGFHNIQFIVGGRVGGENLSGVIGENILSSFDVEYDFANGVMRFFRAEGCGDANLAYWSAGKALSRIQLESEREGRYVPQIHTRAKIDGRSIRVVMDSGVPLSILSKPAVERVGITIASQGVESDGISYGVFGKAQEQFIAPFASFAIGDEEIKNTRLRFENISLPDTDMLLGFDFFLSHRILVATSQRKIYFTYNGGPVFRLDRPQARPPGQAVAGVDGAPAGAGPPAAAKPEELKSASEYARRASASAARRDFQGAIADYTQAITLEPANAANYRARALVRLNLGQPVLAMADLDEALKLQPDDAATLMRRGQLYLGRDTARAKADFEAAMKLSPTNSDLIAQAANGYVNAGLYQDAIRELDDWVAAHLKGYDLSGAYAARCFARAAWGQQLDQALSDCDLALKKDKNSLFLQNRALVLFRLGRLDEAQTEYTAVLKLQPRDANALYGRGLVELKKGQKAEGEADLAAATGISRTIAGQFKRMGLAPDGAAAPAKS